MNERACPSPEDVALFTAGALSEEAWRKTVRHLSECPACRRHAALLAMSQDEPVPRARLRPPLPRSAAPRPRLGSGLLRAAAAAVVFGALGYSLALMNQPPPAPKLPAPPPEASKAPAPSESPKAPVARPAAPRRPEPAPLPRPAPLLPSPPEPREDPPEAPVAPAPGRSPYLARRDGRGIVEAIEVTPVAGMLSVVSEDSVEPLPAAAWVRPSQVLRSDEGATFAMAGGATVHLARAGEVAVAWSQSHLCYAVDLRTGEALVDLGAAPRLFHVASGPLGVGVRLQDSSGQLWLAADPLALRATPLEGTVAYRAPSGEGQTLAARETLVLRPEGDALEPAGETSPRAASRFPTLGAEPRKPAPPAPPPLVLPPPNLTELCLSLGARSYRYRVAGRQLREGAWFSSGILLSAIDELSVVRCVKGPGLHARRGTRAWDDLGSFRPGGREDRTLEVLRRALPPHAHLEAALGWTRGEPQVRAEAFRGRSCTVTRFPYDPELIRSDVELLLEQAILEGRLVRPEVVSWETLEGTIEIVASKDDPRILRAVDRRRVAYSFRTTTPGLSSRRTYNLETVYEFFDHDKAKLVLPAEVLKDLVPDGK